MADPSRLPMPLTYTRIMLRVLGTTPRLRQGLLSGTGISDAALQDPAAEGTLADVFTMFGNAHALCEPGWTLALAARFDLAAQGALGFAMACAPTLGDSFDIMARYGHVRAPWFRLQAYREDGRWGVRIRRQFPVAPHIDIAMIESILLSGQNLVESVLGRPLVEATLYFDFPIPPWGDRYPSFFPGRRVFDSRFAGLGLPDAWRRLPSPLTDAGMYTAALGRLDIERRRLDSPEHVSVRVAMVLEAAGDAGLDLAATAERLNTSRRTLIRRLKAAGTSFGQLLDDHRAQRARTLLSNHDYAVSEIAYRLGYHEPANFTRAFKRWQGETPARYRARGTGGT